MEKETLIVSEFERGLRLDKALVAYYPHYSRTYFQYLIEKGLVLLDGEVVKKRTLLEIGSEIEVQFTLTPEIDLTPENIPLDLLYEDEWILAVHKPAGMVVHPGAGHPSGTFVNALLYHCKNVEQKDPLRPGIVHRLDKDTSGVLIAAKTERAQQHLVEQFATRKTEKEYIAICLGNPGDRKIEARIGRHPVHRKEMSVVNEGGKAAVTFTQTLAHHGELSVVRLFPHTGRTHQLRVHLKSIGTPILGDSLYGSPSANKRYHADRQFPHAHSIRFFHPITQAIIEIKAPFPSDIKKSILEITKTTGNLSF